MLEFLKQYFIYIVAAFFAYNYIDAKNELKYKDDLNEVEIQKQIDKKNQEIKILRSKYEDNKTAIRSYIKNLNTEIQITDSIEGLTVISDTVDGSMTNDEKLNILFDALNDSIPPKFE